MGRRASIIEGLMQILGSNGKTITSGSTTPREPLHVSVSDLFLACNNEPPEGWISALQFGRNPVINSGTDEDIWGVGGDFEFPAAPATLDIVSDSTDDTVAGSGARTMLIEGLDAAFDLQEETINLAGTAPVTTTKTWARVHKLRVVTGGTDDGNVGTIVATHNDAGLIVADVKPGDNQSLLGMYTIPNGYKGRIMQLRASLNLGAGSGVKEATIFIRVRHPGEVFRLGGTFGLASQGDGFQHPFQVDVPLQPMEDIKFRASVNANGTDVIAWLELWLIPIV